MASAGSGAGAERGPFHTYPAFSGPWAAAAPFSLLALPGLTVGASAAGELVMGFAELDVATVFRSGWWVTYSPRSTEVVVNGAEPATYAKGSKNVRNGQRAPGNSGYSVTFQST